MIQISSLTFNYGKHPVLSDVNLGVTPGTLCGLFGPNGSGKSTLFRCCLGLLRPLQGRIRLGGSDVARLTPLELARTVAYVPQESRPPFPFKVKELVLMGRTPHLGTSFLALSDHHTSAAAEALRQLGILDLADARFDQISGGQRQLVLIARAMAQETPTLLLDEPTSALDLDNQVRIWENLRALADRGTTVLACSHDLNHLSWFCDQVVVLSQGRVIADGHPDETVTEAILEGVYREPCTVARVGRARVVVPRNVTGRPQVTSPNSFDGMRESTHPPTSLERSRAGTA